MGYHNQTKTKFVTFHITAGDKKFPSKNKVKAKLRWPWASTSVLTKKPQLSLTPTSWPALAKTSAGIKT